MRLVVLCIAFSLTAQAAPFTYLRPHTSELARRDDEPYPEFTEELDFDIDEDNSYYGSSDTYQDDLSTAGSRLLSLEDDPAFAPIFQHVVYILESAAPAQDKLERILDAIVHHQESIQDQPVDEVSSDELVLDIFKILGSEVKSSDDKIEEIFNEIIENTRHAQRIEFGLEDSAGAVLYRIRWILQAPESAQKRVQMMLNELADHLHPEQSQYGSSFGDGQGQEPFAGVRDNGYEAADVRDDVQYGSVPRLRHTVEDAVGSV